MNIKVQHILVEAKKKTYCFLMADERMSRSRNTSLINWLIDFQKKNCSKWAKKPKKQHVFICFIHIWGVGGLDPNMDISIFFLFFLLNPSLIKNKTTVWKRQSLFQRGGDKKLGCLCRPFCPSEWQIQYLRCLFG